MTEVQTAIVVGGGIAGPVAALALRKAGIAATVYEAYPSTADGIGGTLALAPNGVAALRIVGADEAVAAIATPITRMAMAVGRKRVDLPGLARVEVPPAVEGALDGGHRHIDRQRVLPSSRRYPAEIW